MRPVLCPNESTVSSTGIGRFIPSRPLIQVRLAMTALAASYTVLVTIPALTASEFTLGERMGAIGSAVVLTLVWFWVLRRGRFFIVADIISVLAVLVFSGTFGNRSEPFTIVYMCLVLRPLYGGPTRRWVSAACLTVVAFGIGMAFEQHPEVMVTTAVSNYVGFFLVAVLLSILHRVLIAGEESADRERRLTDRWSALVQDSSDIIAVINAEGTMTYLSPGITRVLGYDVSELTGKPLTDLLEPDEAPKVMATLLKRDVPDGSIRLRHRMLHRDGSWVHIETGHINLLGSESVGGIVLNSRDITETKRLEEQLLHRALHDPLTTLPNRSLFNDRVEHALSRRVKEGVRSAVMFVDLDDFKTTNDTLGHAAGDELLRVVGERIRGCLRTGDTAARLGGDEFAVLLEDCTGVKEASAVADRIIDALDEPIMLEGHEIVPRASIGIAVDSGTSAPASDLLRNADVAMYTAKANGKGRLELYADEMGIVNEEKFELMAAGSWTTAVDNVPAPAAA